MHKNKNQGPYLPPVLDFSDQLRSATVHTGGESSGATTMQSVFWSRDNDGLPSRAQLVLYRLCLHEDLT